MVYPATPGIAVSTGTPPTAWGTSLTVPVTVPYGGTGLATLTPHAIYSGNGTSAPNAIGPDATTTHFLASGGASADSGFRAIAAGDLPATITPTSITSQGASAATDTATLGSELTSSGTCSGTGWTGTYPNYIAPGTTAPLTCTGFISGQFYQTVTTIGAGGSGAVTIAIGTAQTASGSPSGTVTAGLKANGTSLTYTPASTYTGTVGISAKLITPISLFSYTGQDSTGAISFQALYQGLASLHNSFSGGGGSYNTTGSYNSAQGVNALYSNTTGNNNSAQGYQAGYTAVSANANVSGSYNSWFGYNSGPGSPTQYSYQSVVGAAATATCSNCVVLGRAGGLDTVYAGDAGVDPMVVVALATTPVLTTNLKTCTATTGIPWRASVTDAVAPALGVALTGGGLVFANVHCSLTTGTYIVDGI